MSKKKKQKTEYKSINPKHKHDFKRLDGQKSPHNEIKYFCTIAGCDKHVIVVGNSFRVE